MDTQLQHSIFLHASHSIVGSGRIILYMAIACKESKGELPCCSLGQLMEIRKLVNLALVEVGGDQR
ncbi:hypothetical protein M758_12G132400 [Ceratodon purpureus]|uniref:Uncharacterized protein n=1 Tax=Ceratodon purpureus TaxID=3225 RepID=A0A8T0G7A0_CERPU|nr:hypothetical protein KC19_12G129400 [Ceratodon purpureus]KAG0599162.1 hypothetical protein M758_12G132400 [Ceratodon purpureus]